MSEEAGWKRKWRESNEDGSGNKTKRLGEEDKKEIRGWVERGLN